MKKIISILVVGVILIGLVGCGKTNKTESSKTDTSNTEGTKTQTNSTTKNEDTKKEDAKSNTLIDMKIGEEYVVKQSDGSQYSIKIEGIRFTDKRNKFSKKVATQVIFLDFSYKNMDSKDEVYIFESNFKIMDDQGKILESYPVDDDNKNSQRLPIGGQCSASATYAMTTNSKTIKILFYNNMFASPLGQATIETGL